MVALLLLWYEVAQEIGDHLMERLLGGAIDGEEVQRLPKSSKIHRERLITLILLYFGIKHALFQWM